MIAALVFLVAVAAVTLVVLTVRATRKADDRTVYVRRGPFDWEAQFPMSDRVWVTSRGCTRRRARSAMPDHVVVD